MFLGTVEDGAPSDASLLLLSSFFGQKLLNQSLELVDSVVKVACASSGRAFFRIQGNDATPYLVISSFCTCRAFEGHTLASNRALLCKHSLAAVLADKWKVTHLPFSPPPPSLIPPPHSALQRCSFISIPPEEWCQQVSDSLHS